MTDTEQTQTEAQEETTPETPATATATAAPAVSDVELAEAGPDASGGEENLEVLLDIQLPITVTMGKAQLPFRRLLQLRPGLVLNLEKQVGQPAEIAVQDVIFATGDIVVVDDCYAVRIREIINTDAGANAADKKAKA